MTMTHEKRRYSAEELEQIADGLDVHYGSVSATSLALRQAAATEAQVMGLGKYTVRARLMGCTVIVLSDSGDNPENNAVRLIAAAPDLLEALRDLLPFAQQAYVGGPDADALLIKARAAIARAEGEV